MRATNKRVTFESLAIGECFAIGRGRHQRFYYKVGPTRYRWFTVSTWFEEMSNPQRLVYTTVPADRLDPKTGRILPT